MAIVVRLQHHHIHLILNLQNENKNKMLNRLSFLSENDDLFPTKSYSCSFSVSKGLLGSLTDKITFNFSG